MNTCIIGPKGVLIQLGSQCLGQKKQPYEPLQDSLLCFPAQTQHVWRRYQEKGHYTRTAGKWPWKGNNPAAWPVSAPLCEEEREEPDKMTSSGLLVCMFLTKLSETDSVRVT